VFVDQVRIADLTVLDGMPAGDIAAIVVLSGLDGTNLLRHQRWQRRGAHFHPRKDPSTAGPT